jgi:hypothetical protein
MRVGKRILPIEHVALIEPYVETPETPIRTTREFKSRIVLLNRDSVLSETAPGELAEVYAFRMLPTDSVATNPSIHFGVEEFTPADDFKPSKDFLTRLSWTDLDGNSQSKLLLTEPETTLAIAVRGDQPSEDQERPEPLAARPKRKRAPARRAALTQ